jgi:hypothetical protein
VYDQTGKNTDNTVKRRCSFFVKFLHFRWYPQATGKWKVFPRTRCGKLCGKCGKQWIEGDESDGNRSKNVEKDVETNRARGNLTKARCFGTDFFPSKNFLEKIFSKK